MSRLLRYISASSLLAVLVAGEEIPKPVLKDLKELDPKEIKLGEDEPGCKDPALLPRVAGCNIIQCGGKESDWLELQVGASADGTPQTEMADGASEIVYFLCPGKLSPGNIIKDVEKTLVKAGFKAVFSGKDADELPLLTAQKEDQFIQVSTYKYNDYSAYVYTGVKLAPEPPETADAMVEELKGRGRFLLAALAFTSEQTALPDGAEKALAELAGALKAAPEMRVRIEVHTDDLEGPKTSQEITEKRAAAIIEWLTAHGIGKERLEGLGFGSAKPLADNSNDDARARNRRVEIVRL